MLHRTRKLFWAWAIALPLAIGGHPALAAQQTGERVAYADLDLSRPQDVSQLRRRIAEAAERVCGSVVRPAPERLRRSHCIAVAEARAKPQVERVIRRAAYRQAPTELALSAP